MIFVVWTGWGFLVPLLVGSVFILTQLLGNAFFGADFYETHKNTKTFAIVLSAISIWFIGKHFNKKPGRELIDKKTGQEVILKSHNTFFFIKMEYWAIIILLLGIIFSFAE